MINIIPVSHYLEEYHIPYRRFENMGVEVYVSDLEQSGLPIEEFLSIILKTDLRMMGITDIYERNKLWWRIWITGKVPEWDEVYELVYLKPKK